MADRRTQLGRVGIEKIRVYPTSLSLDLESLAQARGYDVNHLQEELMIYERGVNPVWEDAVTMAVNAAKSMLTPEDVDAIGLLIVATETGLDLEKSLSSWVHHFLSLPSSCRHFELKGACYSGTAGLKMAVSWLLSGMARPGQKALVIASDQSLNALGQPWEYIGGAGAVAMLVSDQPDFLEIEPQPSGVYAHEVSDVIRPMPWLETGNSEHSLFSYMEALLGAYDDYVRNVGTTAVEPAFNYHVYHVPFSGISYRAHKQLLRATTEDSNGAIKASFALKTQPSIRFPQRIGATYGGSVFIALLSLVWFAEELKAGNSIGVYSYGSGSCAEFYRAVVGEKAKAVAAEANLPQLLDQRKALTVEEYEAFENARIEMIQNGNFQPDFTMANNVFHTHFENRGLLIYKGSQNYYRSYEFV